MVTYLMITARATLGIVLTVSIFHKLVPRRAFREFVDWLTAVTGTSVRLALPLAVAILLAESVVLVLIAVNRTAVPGLLLGAAMMITYAIGIGWFTRHGVSVPCRCFGAATSAMGRVEIARNAGLAILCTFAASVSAAAQPLPVALTAQAALVGCGLAMVTIRFRDIVRLYRPLEKTWK